MGSTMGIGSTMGRGHLLTGCVGSIHSIVEIRDRPLAMAISLLGDPALVRDLVARGANISELVPAYELKGTTTYLDMAIDMCAYQHNM